MQALEVVPQVPDGAWAELVAASPQGHDFLQPEVLRFLAAQEHPPAQVLRVGVRFRGESALVAGWAVLRRQRWGRRYARSFPLFYAGPLLHHAWCGGDKTSQRLTIQRTLAKALSADLDLLDTETMPGLPDVRGFIHAGFSAEQIYTHVWPSGAPGTLPSLLNRSKRREMQAAAALHTFAWLDPSPANLHRFHLLHDLTLKKFKWHAPDWWKRQLTANVRELAQTDRCRLFTASPEGQTDFCAAVTVLLSRQGSIAWFWRVGYNAEHPGLIPALYVRAAQAIKEEFGPDWSINFGGSPRPSLALFKDYLGAISTPHWRLRWVRPGWKSLFWSLAENSKEGLRQAVYQLQEKLNPNL